MRVNLKFFNLVLVLTLLLVLFAPQSQQQVLAKATQAENVMKRLQDSCLDGGRGIMSRADSFTGYSQFIRTEAGKPIRTSASLKSKTPADAAYAFLTECGGLLGLQGGENDLSLLRERSTSTGGGPRTTVRFQQEYKGIPVVAGEIFVQFDEDMNILAIGGEVLPRIYLDTTPTTEASMAQANALKFVARGYQLDVSKLTATEPVLKIYDSALIEPWDGPTLLVWEMEISQNGSNHLREYVLVNAQRGNVIVSFNQVDAALDLATYDNNGASTLPPSAGNLVCTEADPECDDLVTDQDAKAAHVGAKNTYDFYFNQHGRDSIDGAGMQLVSVVDWDDGESCPNAFWDGSQMVYCDTLATADDVVAHELTHGVTEHESGLFYYYQSGAINESLSDIWGEFIDLTSSTGFDDDSVGVRWEMGEDVAAFGGAIRDMSDPTLFNDPDKMSSIYYHTEAWDNGGVHINSGIGNKAAYLMTDGDTFNGYTVTGLGIYKTAAIYYEVQTNFLTSGSDYRDLHDALLQACENLTGTTPPNTTEVTSADCVEVLDAVSAVEMDDEPSYGFNPEAPVCDLGTPLNLFNDDIENATYNWNYDGVINTPNTTDYPHWYKSWWYATTGIYSIYGDDFDYDGGNATSDTFAVMRSRVHLPVSLPNAYLRFNHAFGFDDDGGVYYDGGVLEYSLNNGSTWLDAGALIDDSVYGYNGTLDYSPLAGRAAFVGDSHGYISSRLDLSSLLGKSVLFRWRMATDSSIWDWGWWVDDVQIYSCMDPVPTISTQTFKSEKARDGWVLESTETSSKGGTINTTAKLQVGDDASDRQYRSILSFNTASLPDNAVITSVRLRLKQYNLAGANPFNTHGLLLVDVRKAKFGTLTDLQTTDFQASASLMSAGPFNPTAVNKWRIAEIDSAIPFVHKTGVTQFRLRFSKDDNDDSGADFFRFYSGETSSSAPQLIVEYYIP